MTEPITTAATPRTRGMATVLREDDGVALRFERHLNVDVDVAWAAITEPEQLRRWFMPTTIEPRLGGEVRVDGGPEGSSQGVVTAWQPPHLLSYTWQWTSSQAQESVTEVRWELAAHPDGCRLTFTHSRLESGWVSGYGAGWHGFLDVLAEPGLDAGEVEESVRPAYEKLYGAWR